MTTYRYLCANYDACHNEIFTGREMVPGPNLLCRDCYTALRGDRWATRKATIRRQGYRCIVRGCPWQPKQSGKWFHLHRITKGADGGRYEIDNCVLVCPHHHRTIEGLSREEIAALECTPKQIKRMGTYFSAQTLLDYDFQDIEKALLKCCEELGVPAVCTEYNIIAAIRRELNK